MKFLKRADEFISIMLLVVLTITSLLQVLFRFVFNLPLDWSEEVTRYVLITLVYLSTALSIKEDKTIRIEIVDVILKGKPKIILDIIVNIISSAFLMFIAYQATFLVTNAIAVNQTSPSLEIPLAIMYGIESFMFALMSLMFVYQVVKKVIKLKEWTE